MNFWSCWCGYRMPETNRRAIAAHRVEHPTEEQIRERRNAEALRIAVDAMDGGRQINAFDRSAALHAILNAKPETIFEELWRKPLRKQLGMDDE